MISRCVALMALAVSVAQGGVLRSATARLHPDRPERHPGHAVEDRAGRGVLEWVNPDCPFVQRHYKAGTMKRLAAEYAAKGVTWLTINSTNYMDAEANRKFAAANGLTQYRSWWTKAARWATSTARPRHPTCS